METKTAQGTLGCLREVLSFKAKLCSASLASFPTLSSTREHHEPTISDLMLAL